MMTREIRNVTAPLELRGGPDKPTVGGYAARFNRLSQNLGGFVEQIAVGAFRDTLAQKTQSTRNDIRALVNHDERFVLGRTANGTLRVGEDSEGLVWDADANTAKQSVRDFLADVERGDINQGSFAFRTVSDSWGVTDQGFPLRTLEAVELFEVSAVTFPAYLDTDTDRLRHSALAGLAEQRGVTLADAVVAADQGRLVELIAETSTTGDEAGPVDPTPRLTVARQRLARSTARVR